MRRIILSTLLVAFCFTLAGVTGSTEAQERRGLLRKLFSGESSAQKSLSPGESSGEITVGGTQSTFLVYTPPALRGRGYATACVGALSRLLLDAGWALCALFADVANLAANRVYERVGYRPVCEVDEILFSAGDAHTVLPPM